MAGRGRVARRVVRGGPVVRDAAHVIVVPSVLVRRIASVAVVMPVVVARSVAVLVVTFVRSFGKSESLTGEDQVRVSDVRVEFGDLGPPRCVAEVALG
jgi:hypothetical protein